MKKERMGTMGMRFGLVLKEWRGRRRMSQLDLGHTAKVSPRHIAFLETGRARPSRTMVLQLSEALDMPRAARNILLNAAGFASAYRTRTLADGEMAHVRAAVDWTLARHDPYPAFALDRHWALVAANQMATMLLAAIGIKVGDSLLDAMIGPGPFWSAIENGAEIARYVIARLRLESEHLGGDPVLDTAVENLLAKFPPKPSDTAEAVPPVVSTRLRAGETTLSFFSTIAQFGTAEDMALADLRIELLFPADEATNAALTSGPPRARRLS
jgi:transcriptional regulator with XRE-family HTH domain